VPVAAAVAAALGAPLDLLLVRKIGIPGNPEFGIGAVVDGRRPELVVDEQLVESLGITRDYIEQESTRALTEIERQRRLYLLGRQPPDPAGRTVIVVDDGVATGGTVRVALRALALSGAARRVLAVPVAPAEAAEPLRALCDEAVFLATPTEFRAVSDHYQDFRQIEDAEVIALLDRSGDRQSAGAAGGPSD
jgi:putative phosphoribosyl transferase